MPEGRRNGAASGSRKKTINREPSNDEYPTSSAPVKRQRVSRACDQCRAAREKCDGIQPLCYTCASSNRTCSYTTNPKKRGIQPGYIRSLELALAWTFSNLTDSEAALQGLLQQESGQALLASKDSDAADKLHRTWRKSTFCKSIDKLLSGADEARVNTPVEDSDEDDLGGDPALAAPAIARGNISNAPRKYRLPPNFWRLLDVYFAYTHCWFPLAEKQEMLKTAYSYPEAGLELSPSMADSGKHAELWSILTLAAMQDPNVSAPEGSLPDETMLDAKILYETCRKLIPDEQGDHHVGHVSALLILSLIHIGSGNLRTAWLLITSAVSISDALGLKTGFTSTQMPNTARASHVYLGCFVLDTIVAFMMHRKPSLHADDVRSLPTIDEDGLEEWQPWVPSSGVPHAERARAPAHSLSIFNATVRLMQLLRITMLPSTSAIAAASALEEWERQRVVTRQDRTPQHLLMRANHLAAQTIVSADMDPSSVAEQLANTIESFSREHRWTKALPLLQFSLTVAYRTIGSAPMDGTGSRIVGLMNFLKEQWSGKTSSRDPSTTQPRATHVQPSTMSGSSEVHDTRVPSNQLSTPISLYATSAHSGISPVQTLPLSSSVASRQRSTVNLDFFEHGPGAIDDYDFRMPSTRTAHTSQQYIHNQDTEQNHMSAYADLDALFDELASQDGSTHLDTQPLFMQNLGFAPDATLNDVFTADYGQYDPLLDPQLAAAIMDNTSIGKNPVFDAG